MWPDPAAPLPWQVVRVVDALGGVTVSRSSDVKDEIVLVGNDIQNVSRTCALIQQICAVKRKDIRKVRPPLASRRSARVIFRSAPRPLTPACRSRPPQALPAAR